VVELIPLDSRRKHEEVAKQIRELAIKRSLPPGSRLPNERALAAQLRVSRTVVRDAFVLLESQGFLTVKRGRQGGAHLEEMHPRHLVNAFGDMLRLGQASIPQLLDARLGIETSLLNFIPAVKGRLALTELEANVCEAARLKREAQTQPNARVALLRNLHDFHVLLAAATKNPVFILSVGAVIAILQKYLDDIGHHTCVSLDSVGEHQAVLAALKEGRIADAQDALREHLRNDSRRTVALLRRREAQRA
jgi:GntR family transcriptional regulator, transcriptional repressor for pyruvate dehydrogenase complex